ncbi:hypothetical protein AGMMS49546_23760 [Spirochaetia bacterium]|nr:hypothetical protein AGMMS49546_23760 [Spirochaetia bacterium]
MGNFSQNVYPESTAIVGMAQSVWDGNKEPARVNFSLSDKLKAELRRLLGKDIESIFITDSDVRHIKKNHGQNEAKRGQVDITPADFALIPLVMNDFNNAEQTETDRLGNRKIIFTKKIDEIVYVAGVEKGSTKMRVITLWKRPGRVLNADGGL